MSVFLHQSIIVGWNRLPWRELVKAAITAGAAGLRGYRVASGINISGNRLADIEALCLIVVTWAGAVAAGLWLTQSQLPGDLRRRKGTVLPRVAERQAEVLTKGIQP